MSGVSAVYEGDLCVECELERTGDKIMAESKVKDFGKGRTFSPTDLFATALAACALNVMGLYCNRKNIDIVGANARVEHSLGGDPICINKIAVTFTMPAKGYDEKQRAVITRCLENCPVHNSIGDKVEQTYVFVWLDDEKE